MNELMNFGKGFKMKNVSFKCFKVASLVMTRCLYWPAFVSHKKEKPKEKQLTNFISTMCINISRDSLVGSY